jgi:thiamine biosynthesis lipoprotein
VTILFRGPTFPLVRFRPVIPGLILCVGLLVADLAATGVAVTADYEAAPDAEPTLIERHAYLMGTRVTLITETADRAAGSRDLERMLRVLEATESELSTWRDDSLLSALNRQPVSTAWQAPRALCELFADLVAWHRETDGAFDPAVGALVDAWALREGGRRPPAALLEAARGRSGLRHIGFERDRCLLTRHDEVILDAGAFGKGEALDRVVRAERHRSSGPWLINLGGQVVVGGTRAGGWPVALAHPSRRDESVLELRLMAGSLATSGGAERDHWVDGVRVGHVLDPRIGQPVSRPASVTVWHLHGLVADVLSTALYVMGVEEGLAWAEARRLAVAYLVPGRAPDRQLPRVDVELRATLPFRQRFLAAASTSSRP